MAVRTKKKMLQAFRVACIVTSVLLLLPIGDAAPENHIQNDKNPNIKPANSASAPSFIKHASRKMTEVVKIASNGVGDFLNEVGEELNESLKNSPKSSDSIVSNLFSNYVWQPAKALAKVSLKKVKIPVDGLVAGIKQEYPAELEKAKEKTEKSKLVNLASRTVAAGTVVIKVVGNETNRIKEMGKAFWNK